MVLRVFSGEYVEFYKLKPLFFHYLHQQAPIALHLSNQLLFFVRYLINFLSNYGSSIGVLRISAYLHNCASAEVFYGARPIRTIVLRDTNVATSRTNKYDEIINELIQTGAVVIAMIESLERNKNK